MQVGDLDVNVFCVWVEGLLIGLCKHDGTLVVTLDDSGEQGIESEQL